MSGVMDRAPLVLACWVSFTSFANAQSGNASLFAIEPPYRSECRIGNYGSGSKDVQVAMTPDGNQIVLLEHIVVGGCTTDPKKLVLQRVDGADRQVLLTGPQLDALIKDSTKGSSVVQITLSGDGRTAALLLPDELNVGSCLQFVPWHIWLLDLETGAVEEIDPAGGASGYGIVGATFSDDGERLLYERITATAHELVVADRTTTTRYDTNLKIVQSSGDFGVGLNGIITGDGKRCVYIGTDVYVFPTKCHVYVLDIDTGRLKRVTSDTFPNLVNISASRDGSRIIFTELGDDPSGRSIYGINADGSGLHVVAEGAKHDTATLSRDGHWVFFASDQYGTYSGILRVPFEGGTPERVGSSFFNGYVVNPQLPISSDGRLLAYRINLLASALKSPLAVVALDEPRLSVYGDPELGQALICDVGAPTGTTCTLLASLFGATQRTPWGVLGLHPGRIEVLSTGVTVGPANIASQSIPVPNDAALLGYTLHLQALVLDGFGPKGGRLTNHVAVELP